jgi:hypothetical protein
MAATSAIRSVPDAWRVEVMTAAKPWRMAAAAMRGWSVAMITSAAPLLRARSATRTTIGFPATSASGLPGNRAEA